ncbi:putative FAD binding domain-containing protein, partial [Colletotrichum sublineola]
MRPSTLAALLLASGSASASVASARGRSTTRIRTAIRGSTGECKYLPGDAGWPSADAWARLNETVGGRLIATVPLGSPCHGAAYNATECARLQDAWLFSEV